MEVGADYRRAAELLNVGAPVRNGPPKSSGASWPKLSIACMHIYHTDILDELRRGHRCRPAVLDKMYRSKVTEGLVKAIQEQAGTDRDQICDFLMACYLDESHPQCLRQTSVYLLARIRQGDSAYASELLKKVPYPSQCFLYRGFGRACRVPGSDRGHESLCGRPGVRRRQVLGEPPQIQCLVSRLLLWWHYACMLPASPRDR